MEYFQLKADVSKAVSYFNQSGKMVDKPARDSRDSPVAENI